MGWFQFDRVLRHERVKPSISAQIISQYTSAHLQQCTKQLVALPQTIYSVVISLQYFERGKN